MRIIKDILQTVQMIVAMPKNIAKIDQLNSDLKRVEQKLDDFIDMQSNLGTNLDDKFENQFLQTESLLAIYKRLPNLKLLPPTRGWAGSPDFLAKISELILKEKPCLILETGSGVSTIIIGAALEANNKGKVISLDHNEFYSKVTKGNIELNEIADRTEVIYSDLVEYNINGQNWKWYEINPLEFSEKIDMLIIDGPPGSTQPLARYPAVPLLFQYFSDSITILLDDSNRIDESTITQKWKAFLEENNFTTTITTFDHFEKGLAVIKANRRT